MTFFLAMVVVFPVIPGMIPETFVEDVKLCHKIMDALRHESFWGLLVHGDLPCYLSPSLRYHGPGLSYYFLPVFFLFGANLFVVEFGHLFLVVPTLLFVYFLVKGLFNRSAGILALILLIIHPGFLVGTRLGVFYRSYMQFFSIGSLYLLWRWRKSGKMIFFAAGLFVTALGLTTMAWFYWYVAGLMVLAVLYRRELWEENLVASASSLVKFSIVGIVCLAAGSLGVIYREIFQPGNTSGLLVAHLLSEDSPYSLRNYFETLPQLTFLITEYLAGLDWQFFCWPGHLAHVPVKINEYVPWPGNFVFPFFLWGAVLFLLLRGMFLSGKKHLLIFPVLLLVMILLAPLSPYGVHMHLFFLYPFPQLVLAAAIAEVWMLAAGRRWLSILTAVFLAVFVLIEARGVVRFFELYDRPVLNYPAHLYDVQNYMFPEEPRDVQKMDTRVKGDWRWPGIFFRSAKKVPL